MTHVITDASSLRGVVKHFLTKPAFVFDVETVGDHRGDPVRNEVLWISLACDDQTVAIPMGHPNGDYVRTEYPLLTVGIRRQEKGLPLRPQDYSRDEKKATKIFTAPPKQLSRAEVFEALEPLFFDEDILKIGHNVKFDIESITKYYGQIPEGPFFDTMIASWVLDTRRVIGRQLGLAACLQREFGHTMVKGVGKEVENYSFGEVAEYSSEDSYWDFKLYEELNRQLREDKLTKVMKLEMLVLAALCRMELHGANIDQESLKGLYSDLSDETEQIKGKIFQIAGKPFNMNSNVDKQDLLFTPKKAGGRGLRPRLMTASGNPSVSADALEKYRGKDELVDAMLEYADVNKLLSTYVIPYLGGSVVRTTGGKSKVVEKETMLVNGKLHTTFQQHGAETGRFSSKNPNLQNVPNARTEHGKKIRNLFYAPDGQMLVCADYSQVEPRIIASFSQDPVLHGAYERGEDVYTAIANPLGLGRAAGKVAVLAMSYGVGPDKVESSLGLPAGTGKDLLKEFEKQFAQVYRYKRQVVAAASNKRPTPYVETLLGRRRYLPDLRSPEFALKSRAERQAFNTRIQGTGADIMKMAIARAHAMLPDEAYLIGTVHDELLTICPEGMAEDVAEIIRQAMEGINVLDIPLLAEVKIAKTWGDAK